MAALLDTGVLVAVLSRRDRWHDACVTALQGEPQPWLPIIILPEVAHLVLRDMGHTTLVRFLRSNGFQNLQLIETSRTDIARAAEILEHYADNRVDLVDCVIVALAERLKVTRLLTLDRRHFSIIRPRHCPAFDLFP
jgi:hypothetical protein